MSGAPGALGKNVRGRRPEGPAGAARAPTARRRSAGRAPLLGLALLALAVPGAGAGASEPEANRDARPDARPVALPPALRAGREVYARCRACHALERDRTGPRHCGLLGRRAGSVPGFDYSPALREADFVWTRETLGRFLADPWAAVPGTFMGYAGIEDPQERAQLVAYLAWASRHHPRCRGEAPGAAEGAARAD